MLITNERKQPCPVPEIDPAATGANILRLRKAAGLTVSDLQILFDFSTPQAIYKWQTGATLPTLAHMAALAKLFGVTMEEIIVCRLAAQECPAAQDAEAVGAIEQAT